MAEVDDLIRELRDGTREVRRNAAIRLGRLRNEKVVSHLIAALHDSYDMVRVAAIQSLSWIQDPRMTEPLLDMVSDSSRLVRKNAIEVLSSQIASSNGRIRDKLENALVFEKDEDIRNIIKSALS